MIKYDTRIHIPYGELPEKIKIGLRYYNTRDILNIIERITGKRIISKRENRALRHMQNTTIQLPIIYNQNSYDPLYIVTKEHTYSLTPQFR